MRAEKLKDGETRGVVGGSLARRSRRRQDQYITDKVRLPSWTFLSHKFCGRREVFAELVPSFLTQLLPAPLARVSDLLVAHPFPPLVEKRRNHGDVLVPRIFASSTTYFVQKVFFFFFCNFHL